MKEVKAPGGSSCGDGPLALDDILFAQEAMAAICERLAGVFPGAHENGEVTIRALSARGCQPGPAAPTPPSRRSTPAARPGAERAQSRPPARVAEAAFQRPRRRLAFPTEPRELVLALLLEAQQLRAPQRVRSRRRRLRLLDLLPVLQVALLELLAALERVEVETLLRRHRAGAEALDRLLELERESVGLLLAEQERARGGVVGAGERRREGERAGKPGVS